MWRILKMRARRRGDAETRRQTKNAYSGFFDFSPRPRVPASPRLLLTALLAAAAGCSTREKVVYEPVNTKPIVGDDAMALRADWPRGVSRYQNGAVAAWSTRFPYETKASVPEPENLLVEPTMFLIQTVWLPADLIANPPGQPQVWHGVEWRPTYTAQPPLPPRGGPSSGGGAYSSGY